MDKQQQNTVTLPDIAVVFAGTATKASGSALGFEVGRDRGTDTLFFRIVANDGGGTFTKAWQPAATLREVLEKYRAEGKPVRFAEALGPAIPQKGRNNAPFVGYTLASLGFLVANAEKPGEYAVAGDWEAWREAMLALPVPEPPPAPAPVEPPASDGAQAPAGDAPAKGKRASKKSAAKPGAASEPANVIPVGGDRAV